VIFLHLCESENTIRMALIKSISGIRGTIGGKPGESLTPVDIVKFTAAYGIWLQQE
jgi:phosphomannomutase